MQKCSTPYFPLGLRQSPMGGRAPRWSPSELGTSDAAATGSNLRWMTPAQSWGLGIFHRLSKVEREYLSSQVGCMRLWSSWNWRHSRSAHGRRKVGISHGTAALGSTMIEGAAETLLPSPSTLGSHKMKFSLWGKDNSRARGSTDHHFPHSVYS